MQSERRSHGAGALRSAHSASAGVAPGMLVSTPKQGRGPVRDETIAALQSAPPWKSYEMTGPLVVELRVGWASSSTASGRSVRDGEPFSAVVSSTFVRESDDWKLPFHQQPLGDSAFCLWATSRCVG